MIKYRNIDAAPGHNPRVAPPARCPPLAGTIVIAVALPVFLIAGWRIAGWGLAAVLWVGSEALGCSDAAAAPDG